ncbi:O-antigen ligase family protein [Bacillus sp. BGMRC 2118]|nr:O-antigen ligase family protein [Bacillus sp. BGMRC 2118]
MFILAREHNIRKGPVFNFTIRKSTVEWLIIISLLIFSFINNYTLLISLLFSLLLLRQKEIGAIKILNLVTFRTIINPGIAIDIAHWQSLKWGILFVCSIYLIKAYFKLDAIPRRKVRKITNLVLIFMIYNVITALIYSTLPTIAIFKLFSYVLIFLGVLIGISYTNNKFNWINWSFKLFTALMMFSLPMVIFPIGYLRNGHAFQGLTNQPNMFGIVAALSIAIILTAFQTRRIKYRLFTLLTVLPITMYMIILSKSRTAFLTGCILFLIYIFIIKFNRFLKVISINILVVLIIVFVLLENTTLNYLIEFIYKGQSNLLFSRENQVAVLMNNFLMNPWFGNGFAVPVTPYRSFSFSTEYVVEPGNLILSILSYSGIIGFMIFVLYIIRIFLINIMQFSQYCYLPVAAILISMGEMVFFSSNNIGIWCYMFISMYMSPDIKHRLE